MSGDQAPIAQRLMVEIATARAVLTTPTGKDRYDAKLREQPDFVPNAVPAPAAVIEELLPPSAQLTAAPPRPFVPRCRRESKFRLRSRPRHHGGRILSRRP